MMKKLILAILLMGATALAQSCPVEVETIKIRDIRHNPGYTYSMKLHWKNVSQKTIVGARWRATYTDAVGDEHKAYENYLSTDKTKPGKSTGGLWGYDILGHDGYTGAEVHLMKVMFDDGTVWEDDGSHTCGAASTDDKTKQGSWWTR